MTTINTDLLHAIAQRVPSITLANALGLVEDFQRYGYEQKPTETRYLYDLSTFDGRVAYAGTLSEVTRGVEDNKKIQAIKALRQHFSDSPSMKQYSGLKECKDVVDQMFFLRHGTTYIGSY